MHHTILLVTAWLFATGFAYQATEVDGLRAVVIHAILAPIAFPFVLGKSLARFLSK